MELYDIKFKIGQTVKYQEAVFTYNPCVLSHYVEKVGYIWHINIWESDKGVSISYKISKDSKKFGWCEVFQKNILEVIN